MNSCGTIKISNVEKRRYNDGYYVNVSKNKKDKNSSEYKREDVTSLAPSENKTKEDLPPSNSYSTKSTQKVKRKIRISSKEKATSKPKFGFNSSGPLNFHKRRNINFSQKILKPSGKNGDNYLTTGLIIAGIIFIVLIILKTDILLTLLVALLFAVVIVFLLKELEIISK